MASPHKNTLRRLRSDGIVAETVEYQGYGQRTHDLLGFIDIVALCPTRGIIGIQATSRDHISHRREKIKGPCAKKAAAWLTAGGSIEIRGWSTRGPRQLELKIEAITLKDL